MPKIIQLSFIAFSLIIGGCGIFGNKTSNAVIVKANTSGGNIEVWFVGSRQTGFETQRPSIFYTEDKGLFVHVIADSAANNMELSIGGSDSENGVGCGVQLRTRVSMNLSLKKYIFGQKISV